MKKLFLIFALILLPFSQAFAGVTIEYDIEGRTELSTNLTGRGAISAPSGFYDFKMYNGSFLSCKADMNFVEGNRYKIYNTTEGCGIQNCGTAKECPPL
ncbi:MAG TPA: hypothetical protein VMW10_06225 [Alphaproteobacteria bacterium]|nr:hypothetical protein [Alphaproteobacteria bacterium]